MSLFRHGPFTLSGGQQTSWKIDCDALNGEDWVTLAHIGAGLVPPFYEVEAVPGENSETFAQLLLEYAVSPEESISGAGILIVDDVMTTGASLERLRAGRRTCWGLVAFSRHPEGIPWITPIFQLSGRWKA